MAKKITGYIYSGRLWTMSGAATPWEMESSGWGTAVLTPQDMRQKKWLVGKVKDVSDGSLPNKPGDLLFEGYVQNHSPTGDGVYQGRPQRRPPNTKRSTSSDREKRARIMEIVDAVRDGAAMSDLMSGTGHRTGSSWNKVYGSTLDELVAEGMLRRVPSHRRGIVYQRPRKTKLGPVAAPHNLSSYMGRTVK